MRKTRIMIPKREAYIHLFEKEEPCFDGVLVGGISYVEDNYHIGKQCSDVNVLEYIIAGTLVVETPDGRKCVLKKGDSYFLPINEGYYYYPGDNTVQHAKIFVNFTGTVFPEMMARFGINDIYVFPGT